MSKFKKDNWVRVTDPTSTHFDQVGDIVDQGSYPKGIANRVQLPGALKWFTDNQLTLADPDVHTVLDQMDAESALPQADLGPHLKQLRDITEQEIDGDYVRGLAAAEFGTPCLTAKQWEAATKPDPVNHPAHYGGDTTYEVIKVAEAWGLDKDAYLFNVLKYVARAGKKGDVLEDLEKGDFYLNRRIATIKAAQLPRH